MNTLRTLSCCFVVALGLGLHAASAGATPTTVSCGTAINGYFTGVGDWLDVVGTRVTARSTFGFSSFTMDDSYDLATMPLDTSAASSRSSFMANKGSSSNYEGQFHEVFPDRGNDDVDLGDFWVYTSGAVWLRSITWGGSWTQLQGVTCFQGPQNQTVIRGYIDTPGYGTDFWTFVVRGEQLI